MNQFKRNPSTMESPSFHPGSRILVWQKKLLWELLQKNAKRSTPNLLQEYWSAAGELPLGLRQVNRLREQWNLSAFRGRPRGSISSHNSLAEVRLSLQGESIPCLGAVLFDAHLEGNSVFSEIMEALKNEISTFTQEHPHQHFPLLVHRDQTLLFRFKALFYAPLFSIGKLTGYDLKETSLEWILGRDYRSSTLNQFLAQLEWINAAPWLTKQLAHFVQSSVSEESLCYIDGHMIPFWTSRSMHKGKITMLGRIMAGSQAVIAHNEEGNAIFSQYYPPDTHLSSPILEYCQQIVDLTGIQIFVIDREINSVEIAVAFESRELGLISMLNSNQYQGLSDWDAKFEGKLEDDSLVYSGYWKDEKKKAKDPRWFVIVETQGRLLPYWGTAKVKETFEAIKIPQLYSQRTEIQENDFKRMISYAALNVNFGIKIILGMDRHQERKYLDLAKQRNNMEKKIGVKKEQIEELEKSVELSIKKSHKKLLEVREKNLEKSSKELKKLKEKDENLQQKIDDLGPTKERMDRDFRKQSIMTFRSLFLGNQLRDFWKELCQKMASPVSLELLLSLLFSRTGRAVETKEGYLYLIKEQGLSEGHQQSLQEVVKAINEMALAHQGKIIKLQIQEDQRKKKKGKPPFDPFHFIQPDQKAG